ncbi:hypothetical protein SAMN02745215_05231 [Desulfitobacterium chlororespirans DSM 11544]|uniref:Uncharacterized protein n=1 Tax=Desulfitobacterium chlororespirans DSM 11544 TaxID=1121395 RepID=A0A1M7UYX7_9FIRM|nr:hypothetical protein SAMN02745215_05231 [Desulfitobacterium chlororespirans DSM 11544]
MRAYGEEYVALSTSKYTGVKSVYKHVEGNRISVHLTVDPVKIADDKYNALLTENEALKTLLATTQPQLSITQDVVDYLLMGGM